MTSDVDPLDEGLPRDWQHRPLIVPLKRGKPDLKVKLATYTRASTFAKALDDGGGLTTWKVRHATVGVACSPDLAAMIAALGRNLNGYSREDKANLDEIIARAHDRSGGNEKADYGTAVHSLTEPDRADADPLAIDDRMGRDVAAYEALIEYLDVDVIGTETFVVNDELVTGGTFDHTVRLRSDLTVGEVTLPAGTILVVDKKTGTLHVGQHAIQLAIYARGKTYDHVTGERGALNVSPQWGIVAHVPRGEGKAVAYLVDLHAGWKAAKLAVEVRAYRSTQRKIATRIADIAAPVEAAVVETVPGPRIPVPTLGNPHGTIPGPAVAVEPTHVERGLSDAELRAQTAPEPALEPVDETAAAVELLKAKLDATDPILDAIKAADGRDACAALWREHSARGAWRDEHNEAVRARLAELAA